jgi:hypothetical protein
MFKSKKQLAKALLKGRKFLTPEGDTILFSKTTDLWDPFVVHFNDAEGGSTSMGGIWSDFDKVTEIIEPHSAVTTCCCPCKQKE